MEYASNAKGNLGVTLGAIATGLSALNGGVGNLLGGYGPRNGGDGEGHVVTRYEAGQAARIAELETEVKLRDANAYTDKKMQDLYQYVDGRLRGVEGQISQQAVVNAQITANIGCMQGQINELAAMTKTVIPINNIYPEPMARYNSWTAPTTTTPAATT
nr:MAG TPA: hypothetical protein [Bacteriophage sp.]